MNYETNDKLKKEIFCYYDGEDKFFEEAYDNVMKTHPTARRTVMHTCDVEKDDLFTNIDKAIAFLQKLKKEGYSHIEERWSGYEDNFIIAGKDELETDEEYFRRLAGLVKVESKTIEKREAIRQEARKRISELEGEIRKLKKDMA